MFSNWNELKRPTTAYMAYIATRDWTRDPPFYIHFTTSYVSRQPNVIRSRPVALWKAKKQI